MTPPTPSGTTFGAAIDVPPPARGARGRDHGVWDWLLAHATGLGVTAAVAVAAVTVAVWLSGWARRARADAARRAVWLEITPPATLPPGADVGLWQALGGILRRARHRARWRRVALAVEFTASKNGVSAGIWVPPEIPPRSIARAVRRAWPGARVTRHRRGPTWLATLIPPTNPPAGGRTRGAREQVTAVAELRPPDRWTPLLDPHLKSAGNTTRPAESERLRAVLAALAERRPGEYACAQLVVTTHPHWPTGPQWSWAGRALIFVLIAALRLLAGVLDVLLPGGHRHTGASASTKSSTAAASKVADPRAIAAGKARDAKRGQTPHLHATLRVAVHRPHADPDHRELRRLLRAEVADIAAGYDLTTTALSAHHQRPHSGARGLGLRQPGTGFAVTLAELAALWHLPAEPTRYNLAAPRARTLRHPHTLDHTAAPRPAPGVRQKPTSPAACPRTPRRPGPAARRGAP